MMKELVKLLLLVNILILFTLVIGGCSDKMSENNDDSISNYNKSPNKVLLKKTINRNCKYVLNYWWYEPKDMAFQKTSYIPAVQSLTPKQQEEAANSLESFKNFDNVQYLQIANWQKNEGSEQAILPSCYACRILSSAIHYDIYDSETIGISKEEAVKRTVLLIRSLTKYHCSNSDNGWGNCWQGALWAEMLGMSAFLVKEYLSENDWSMVCNMIRSECDYVINYAGVNVYKDAQGNIINHGDTKSEEDAWNATILALAIMVMPDDAERKSWRERLIELNIVAMASSSDVNTDRTIDGYNFRKLTGSNINEDGTVTNHGKLHIDYMASPIESFAEDAIALSFLRENMTFDCLKFNVDKVYYALVNIDLGDYNHTKAGHHFYERTADGEASFYTNMPENNEWGSLRQANYYLVDTYSSLIGADRDLPSNLQADKWAQCRLNRIVEMTNRDESGRIYQDGEENFVSGQLYAMACLTQVFSLLNGDIIGKN